MRLQTTFTRSGRSEAGAALLIAIFALMLISVVAIALVVSSGTDTALAGNYRMATSAYYVGRAGLEEARGRLLYKNPNYINNGTPGPYSDLFPGVGQVQFGLNDVLYIINPASGETVDPTDASGPYYDNEYGSEFAPVTINGATVHTPPVTSVSPMGGFPGPAFKWVRINGVTEKALGLDVDGLHANDGTSPLYYNGNGLYRCFTAPNCAGNQALELTALAYMQDKSTKLLQYVVAAYTFQNVLPLPTTSGTITAFPAALTLAGNGVSYAGPDASGFYVIGNDPTTGRSCASPPLSLPAIGYTNLADQANVVAGVPTTPVNDTGNYQGAAPSPPAPESISLVAPTFTPALQKPSQIESLIQTVTQGADVVLTPTPPSTTVPASALTAAASGFWPTYPMTMVVNGNLDFTSWHNSGYGLLLVTGNLIYDPDASWQGIVLVMGKGVVTGSRAGIGQFNGAVLVAQSRDPVSGSVLPDPNLGTSSVTFASTMGGNGIQFNSCTIQQALAPVNFKVLSFREISQ
ncbi:MAG TPA: pilus assembly PilX N-terminal domain-containing protein [Candidatus Acidoferrum sp.]|nr:pilus assembly PilX N-terminal domain-containing protein [Candidatus Acidoferrum sp.]